MKDYTTDKIRNVCFMGHGGSGKTSVAEVIAFNSGVTDRLGKVAEGTTVSDYDPEEIKRTVSIGTSLLPIEWKDAKVNILDTPGYFDFVGEVIQSVRVADGAVIILSGKSGVSVGAEKAFTYAEERNIPTMLFVNKLDEENADFFKVFEDVKEKFGKHCVIFEIPFIENGKMTGWVDVIKGKAKKFQKGEVVEVDIPGDMKSKIDDMKEIIKECIAETSEELMEKFFGGEDFSAEEYHDGLHQAVLQREVIPVFCGSAIENIGTHSLMDGIIEYFPSSNERLTGVDAEGKNGAKAELKFDAKDPFAALVFKTIADPFVGKISFFKVCAGTLKPDTAVINANNDKHEKIVQLFTMLGKKQINVSKVVAGDIGAVAKLQNTNTGDTLCAEGSPVIIKGINFPEPTLSLSIEPKAKGDEEKISNGLHKLQDEDKTFSVVINTETHQTVISGIGEQHLDVIVAKLKSKYGVDVNLNQPRVAYRETIRKPIKAEGKHKKQSGGHGQYGHVFIEFEPGQSEDLEFAEKVFGGAVPRQYFPAVEKGLRESVLKGVLAGYPVVNLKATLVDGSYHDVDSSEMAFKIAANLAFKKGMKEASPVLLEPVANVKVTVPEHYMGDVMGDMSKRRGRILGMTPLDGGLQLIETEVPESEMFKYATDLRSMTQARGIFIMKFERYEEAPANVAQKVIEEAAKLAEEEH